MSVAALAREYLDAYFRFHPGYATGRGYPGLDGEPATFDDASMECFRRAVGALRDRVAALPAGDTGDDDAVDLAQLRCELAMATFAFDVLGWRERNPLLYVESGLEAVDALDLRQDLDERARAEMTERRLRGIVPLMRELDRQVRAPMQPFVDAALEMIEAGVAHLAERFGGAGGDRRLAAAASAAMRALDRAHRALSRRARDAQPWSAMGEEAYRFLLANEHLMEAPPDALVALARETLADVESRLPAAMAAERAQGRETPPSGFGRAEVLDYYRREIDAMLAEVERRGLVTIPDGTVELRETPTYLLPVLPGASYQPPPAFGGGRTGYFFVRPVPAEMDDEDRAEYYQTVVHRRFRNLVVHEVCPGHHVQFLHALDHPSPIRKIRDNDVMVEGWALYCEQLMHDEGLFDELPSARPLRALRMRALRVIVDVGLHTGSLSLEGAVDLMCAHFGGGARPWVEREVRRYAAEPTQAMSYLAGREQVLRLREEWRDRVGHARFSLRDFHDRFLAEGSIPVPLIRRKMLARA